VLLAEEGKGLKSQAGGIKSSHRTALGWCCGFGKRRHERQSTRQRIVREFIQRVVLPNRWSCAQGLERGRGSLSSPATVICPLHAGWSHGALFRDN